MTTTQSAPGLRERIGHFFYAEEVPYGLALVRICLPLALLAAAIPRWPHARELYSLDGSPTPLWENFGAPGWLPIPGATLAIALATMNIVALVSLCCGWRSRTSAAIATVLTAYLGLLDSIGTMTKYTCVATHMLLILSLSPCGTLWSIDAWLERRRRSWPGEIGGGYRKYAVWPRRLIQFFIAVIYFAAAITKMQTPAFSSGDQLYFWLLTNVNFANPLGEMLSLWPPMLVALGIGTIVWEIVFPFVCWRGFSKVAVLAFGVVFHALTTVMLGLVVFPLVFFSLYWAFLDEDEMQSLARKARRVVRGRVRLRRALQWARQASWTPPGWAPPSLSGWAFAATCIVAVGIGLEVERRFDLYDLNQIAGRHQLSPMDRQLAAKMLGEPRRIHPEDQLLGFDVGSQTLGGMLANSRESFEYGERAIAQCSVVPPHSDLWLEVNLHDTDNRLLQRSGQVMTREKIRSHFTYDWTEMYPAGEYDLVMKIDGTEVSRRRIRLSDPNRASASRAPATAMVR